jgi:hypothetical protein
MRKTKSSMRLRLGYRRNWIKKRRAHP